jgi:hypothetical protein
MLSTLKAYFQRRQAILALIEGQTLNRDYYTCCKIARKHKSWYQGLIEQYAEQHGVSDSVPFHGRVSQTNVKDLAYAYATYVYRRQFLIKILTDLK